MSSNDDNATLYTLGDRGQTVDASAIDVRGREVRDEDGEGIGKVVDLLVDDRERKVRFLLVAHGGFFGFGDTKTLIPVDAVTEISEQEVFINQSRERVASVPGYTPDLVDDRQYHASIYSHYGYRPHWEEGYEYPPRLAFMFPPSPGISSTI
jgi:sporulation protein YlmC with PRC-barrel domain